MKNAEKFTLLGVFLSTFQTFYTHLKTNIIVVLSFARKKAVDVQTRASNYKTRNFLL